MADSTSGDASKRRDDCIQLGLLGGRRNQDGGKLHLTLGVRQRDDLTWRMRPLTQLAPARLTGATRVWMIVLRGYLLLAVLLVVVRVVHLALGQ